jgi:hypothetical protein
MPTRKIAGLVVLALGLALSGCSLAGPPNHTFLTTPGQQASAAESTDASDSKGKKTKTKTGKDAKTPKPPTDPAEALTAATNACKEATRNKGIKSITAIFSHLRPEAVDQDYIDCMKGKGYTVAK